jgi:Sec1 family
MHSPVSIRQCVYATHAQLTAALRTPLKCTVLPLSLQAKEIRESYNAFRGNKDQSITEIHEFVKRIPGLTQTYKSLNQHINVAELIKQTTDGVAFRKQWQTERSVLEGQ